MATVKGKWVFNDTLTAPTAWIQQELVCYFDPDDTRFEVLCLYVGDAGSTSFGYYENYGERDEMNVSLYEFSSNTWANDSYKTIDIETEQTVSEEFYNWFIANASEYVEPPLPYKFTKLVKAEESESGIDTSTGYRFAFSDDIEQTDDDRLVYVSVYKKPTSSTTYSFRADPYYCGFVFPSATPWYIEELFMGRTQVAGYETLTVYMWGYGAYKINDGSIVTLSASSYSSAESVTLNFGDTITLYAQISAGGIA